MNSATKEIIKKIALDIDHNVAFGGKSKGNKHLLRVVRIARFLATNSEADVDIAVAGAFLHDTALPSGNDYRYENNKRIVRKLLRPLNLSQDERNAIAECAASHEGTVRPKTLEAKVVHDADVLEKVGLLGIIRHTWKLTNSKKLNPDAITAKDVDLVVKHISWRYKKLQTPMARKIANYLTIPIDKRQAKILVETASALSIQGVVTEKIATVVRKHLTSRQYRKLREQLTLTYLKNF